MRKIGIFNALIPSVTLSSFNLQPLAYFTGDQSTIKPRFTIKSQAETFLNFLNINWNPFPCNEKLLS